MVGHRSQQLQTRAPQREAGAGGRAQERQGATTRAVRQLRIHTSETRVAQSRRCGVRSTNPLRRCGVRSTNPLRRCGVRSTNPLPGNHNMKCSQLVLEPLSKYWR